MKKIFFTLAVAFAMLQTVPSAQAFGYPGNYIGVPAYGGGNICYRHHYWGHHHRWYR